ncbi:MAG: RsmG family class I SAM-dependent methyltransferase [Polyangiaceae bacterium]
MAEARSPAGAAASREQALTRALAALAADPSAALAADPSAAVAGDASGAVASDAPAALAADAFAVSEGARAGLSAWLEGIVTWNTRIDLTAARSDDELVDLMVADAVVLARHLPRGARVADIGSGAGAPGLALALLRPDLELTLVEPLDRRVAFLRRTIGALPGPPSARPTVVRGRGEALVQQGRTFDVALSRATLPPPEWLALGDKLAPEGEVWVLLAQGEPPSLPARRLASDVPYRWPLTDVPRRALRFPRA